MKLLKQTSSILVTAVLLIATASSAAAAELLLLGGGTRASHPANSSYSWQLEYRQPLSGPLAMGASYLNEGHVKQHHRDGYGVQLWAGLGWFDRRLLISAAAGPYYYLDTMSALTGDGFGNDHGFKSMLSVATSWRFRNDLLLELRSNWVAGGSSFDTTSVLAGIGYHFETFPGPQTAKRGEPDPEMPTRNEINLLLGQTIVNSLKSQHSVAASLEFRRHLFPFLDWTVAGLYEGDNRLVRRDGILTQIWGVQPLLERVAVAAGVGAYFDVSHYQTPFLGTGSKRFASWVVTLTGSHRFAAHWAARVSWNRVVTTDQRDTDVILAGCGYLF